jgi:hypothetical protein|tara:strand:+ start:178 stop:735 length:558 start_codon:yes stop_codon:yes gene_type:complete
MPKWLEISLYTFSFYCVLFVSWILLVVPLEGDTDISKLGSIAYVPHAGRVLPVLFFGAPAIPAMVFAEFICWNFLWDESIWERPELGIVISSLSVVFAWLLFKYLDLDLKSMRVLKNTDWKHVTLFIIVTALFNGIGNGALMLYSYQNYDPLISIRFTVGDIVGAMSVLLVMMLIAAVLKTNDRS